MIRFSLPRVAALAVTLFIGGCSSVPSPVVRISFDNADPATWENSGALSPGELPSRIGDADGLQVTVSPGVAGGAFDGRKLISKKPGNVPVWGTDAKGKLDTEIETLFDGAEAFTVTAWIKTDFLQPQGRLLKTPAFQINYRGDRLEIGFSKPRKWFPSEVSEERFGSVGKWRFVAIVWEADGLVCYYSGTRTVPVDVAGSVNTDWPVLAGNETGCWLTIGNSEADGNRPFIGLIDELCMWNQSLNIEQLEMIRCRVLTGAGEGK